ncbi:fumarylacetoacetate hydrolase family protein [Brevibacillus laterosporus]|uniref:fumarylacetoacetate hydrolase family protein n=1 Tax=Brevibacillus laterosporus TaxID=1465 RepID=UPI003D23719A
MKLVSYQRKVEITSIRNQLEWRAGLYVGKGIIDIAHAVKGAPSTMQGVLDEWDKWYPCLLEQQRVEYGGFIPMEEVQLGAPIPRPPSFRDFYAFEQHVKTCRQRRDLEMVPEWYQLPVFYFSNPAAFVGTEASITTPKQTMSLDYELEIACVISKKGIDIPIEKADEYIAGFMILNDWSARDIQREEVKVGLGPAKAKDFATSTGPWLVTVDELQGRLIPSLKGNRYDLQMTASINGKKYSQGNFVDIYYTFAQMIARASEACFLYPGDVIGSGTVGSGCLLELGGGEQYNWLQPGDVVELEIDHLGMLRNTIIEK